MSNDYNIFRWYKGYPPSTLANNIDYEIVWFGNRPVAQVSEPTGTRAYTFADHLGTPILQTDATRTVTWRVEYEPFGNVYEVRAGTRTDQPLRFPGQELGMTWEGPEENYNIFRWYKGGWGRYTQADPIAPGGQGVFMPTSGEEVARHRHLTFATFGVRAGSDNETTQQPYGYGDANPLSNIDPNGLRTIPCIGYGAEDNQIPKFSRAGPGLPLIGTCRIVGACADLIGNKVYIDSQEITHPVPCPPCPTKCWYRLDLVTHTVVGKLTCIRD